MNLCLLLGLAGQIWTKAIVGLISRWNLDNTATAIHKFPSQWIWFLVQNNSGPTWIPHSVRHIKGWNSINGSVHPTGHSLSFKESILRRVSNFTSSQYKNVIKVFRLKPTVYEPIHHRKKSKMMTPLTSTSISSMHWSMEVSTNAWTIT